MEKLYISYYPFSVSAETKTSKAGKQYTSIGICQKSKDKDGNKKETYFNLIDERDLLIVAQACVNMYDRIMQAKSEEYLANKPVEQVQPAQDNWEAPTPEPVGTEFNDEIPFDLSRSQ